MTAEQKTEVALRQAQMLLTSYRPGHDDIIIRVKDADAANRVFAALLVLKEKHPELKDVKIQSWVKGCTGPESAWRQGKANETFIAQHLDAHTVATQGDALKKQVETTTETRFDRFKQMNAMNREAIKKFELKEGDTLEQTGAVTRAPKQPK